MHLGIELQRFASWAPYQVLYDGFEIGVFAADFSSEAGRLAQSVKGSEKDAAMENRGQSYHQLSSL